MLEGFTRIAHDCFKIERGGLITYTDPFQLPHKPPVADLVLISHEHFDHLSMEDLTKIVTRRTHIVAPASCEEGLAELKARKHIVAPGDELKLLGVEVRAVAAYNTDKEFHPQDAGHVGYLFSVDGLSVYFAGDTDRIPEMEGLEADVALLPVSGTYVMTAAEAAEAAARMKVKVVVPMHFGAIVGEEADAEEFARLYQGETRIL